MAEIYIDDRTENERNSHSVVISGIDRAMSGWGGAKGGNSVAAWACTPDDADRVFRWVKERGDIANVRMNNHAFRSGAVHTHIYCVRSGHPSINEGK